MKLLIVTQTVDSEDAILGFFTQWIEELAQRFEAIDVICLREGKHSLPANVRVHSLGKERHPASRIMYACRFLSLVWKPRHEYDAVFVHMNQEYILITGWLWKLLGKRIYMWRNHYAGSRLTDIAAAFCTNVFCTSKHAYVAKYRQTVFMPVGVNTSRFAFDSSGAREPRSILFLARIAPSKRPDMLIEALGMLSARGITFSASIYGSPLPIDAAYYESLKARVEALGLKDSIHFHEGVPNSDAPAVFSRHEIVVNCSPSGMFDKTLFEAAASGCLVLAISEDFALATERGLQFDSAESLAERLGDLLSAPESRREQLRLLLLATAEKHSLPNLIRVLAAALEAPVKNPSR